MAVTEELTDQHQHGQPDLSGGAGQPMRQPASHANKNMWREILQVLSNQIAGRDPSTGIPSRSMEPQTYSVSNTDDARAAIEALYRKYGPQIYENAIPPFPGGSDVPSTLDLSRIGHVQAGRNGVPAGLRTNAARGASVVREIFGFNGVIHGIGQRNNKSDHPHGNAIDVMTNDNMALGYEVAHFFVQHAESLGVKYVIFDQTIWSPRNNWKPRRMEDRGSPTANHKDHPHISFY